MELSAQDTTCLQQLEGKLQLIRDCAVGVAQGYATGFHLYGEGGVGKSFTVLSALDAQKANYTLVNSRLSGRAFFDLLAGGPDAVYVLEDVESLTRDKNALGVLRSALWGQGAGPRLVTWTVHKAKLECWFRGGIILIGNRPLEDVPELRAVGTRIASLHLQPTSQEMAALMRSVALRGFRHDKGTMPPAACMEVCEHVIARSRACNHNLNMRLLVNTLMDRLQWECDDTATHWHDLLESRLQQKVVVAENGESRTNRLTREREVARELSALKISHAERERLWREQTGRSGRAYYRRLAEAAPTLTPDPSSADQHEPVAGGSSHTSGTPGDSPQSANGGEGAGFCGRGKT
jgi:hypothetical protein